MHPVNILVVDDDQIFLESVRFSLRSRAEVHCASNVRDATLKLQSQSFDVIVTDYQMNASGDGHDICKLAKLFSPSPPVILITAYASKDVAIDSANLHVFAFLEKPFDLAALTRSVDDAIKQSEKMKTLKSSHIGNAREDCEIKIVENDYSVHFSSERYELTKVEFSIFKVFYESAGVRIDRQEIIKRVWGSAKTSPNLFDTHLRNMKKKLPFLKQRLKSVWGAGYIFSKSATERSQIGSL